MMNSRHSLRFSLTWRVILLSVIAFFGLSLALVGGILLGFNVTVASVRERSYEAARDFDLYVRDTLSYLQGISQGFSRVDDSAPFINDILATQQTAFSAVLVAPDGKVLYQRQRVGVIRRDRFINQAWLNDTRSGRTWLQVSNSVYGVPFLSVAMPVQVVGSSELKASLVVQFDLSALWSDLTAVEVGEEGYAYLTQDDGTLLAYRDLTLLRDNLPIQTYSGLTPAEMVSVSRGAFITPRPGLNGGIVLSVTTPLSSINWFATVESPVSEVLRGFNWLLISMLALFVSVLMLVIAITRFTQRKIVRPLVVMRQGVESFRQGQLDAPLNLPHQDDDEIGVLALTFNDMTSRLRDLINTLEARVADRTRDLQIAAEVSKRVATTLDLDELLPQLVENAAQGFNYSYVFVFLYDEDKNSLYLAAGNGEMGLRLVQERTLLRLAEDRGVVVSTALTRRPTLINDTRKRPDFRYVEVLAETRSEFAVPMIVGERFVGVLDFQDSTLNAFAPDDLTVLTSLGEQFAVAIQNAQLYAEQRRVAEELRALDNMKSQFLAHMSHELRTPLNAIINFTRFVQSGMLGEINTEQRDALERSLDSSRHLLSIINDLLDMTKIEANMMRLFIEQDVDVLPEIEAARHAAQAYLEDKPVRLLLDIPPDLPRIVADRRRVRQVLLNLMSNAAKFTMEGQILVRVRVQGADLEFIVSDTGPGIPPEDHQLIFQPFQQSASGMRQSGGTGLGLPITLRLIEAHGGQLRLESALGQGASFIFTLPIRSEALLAQQAQEIS